MNAAIPKAALSNLDNPFLYFTRATLSAKAEKKVKQPRPTAKTFSSIKSVQDKERCC